MFQDDRSRMPFSGSISRSLLISLAASVAFASLCPAQTASDNQSWNSSNQQGSPDGSINPTRSTESHTVSGNRTVDTNSVQSLGPDGRYVPYSDTEKESVRVNDTTVRTIERTYGRDVDGRRTLIQETQQETRTLPGGEQHVTRSVSSPDGDGRLQVVRREQEDSKQISPGVRVTNNTLSLPDPNGGFAASVRTEQKETRSSDGSISTSKSTLITNGTGGWNLSEVRNSISKPDNGVRTKQEEVQRPDGNGNLSVVERTVTRESQTSAGDKRETVDTYSTNVPGVAGDNGLQLVQRETTVHRDSSGTQSTVQQVEQVTPGSVGGDLHVTQQAIDIVRPGVSGNANVSRTISVTDANGNTNQVWVDTGKTDNPATVQVDTKSGVKPKKK